MKKKQEQQNHSWYFVQNGGLIQPQISTIDDVLNLENLDPKMWTALACPVLGLEFSEETLTLLDSDKNGRVRIPEILSVISYIKKYFAKPEILMTEGDSIPLDALSQNSFCCGHSPLESAKSVLKILGKPDSNEICYNDVSASDKLFTPNVINGDGVLPAECIKDEFDKSGKYLGARPAVETEGHIEYWRKGCLHRDGKQPAIITNGFRNFEFWKKGKRIK